MQPTTTTGPAPTGAGKQADAGRKPWRSTPRSRRHEVRSWWTASTSRRQRRGAYAKSKPVALSTWCAHTDAELGVNRIDSRDTLPRTRLTPNLMLPVQPGQAAARSRGGERKNLCTRPEHVASAWWSSVCRCSPQPAAHRKRRAAPPRQPQQQEPPPQLHRLEPRPDQLPERPRPEQPLVRRRLASQDRRVPSKG